MPNKVIANVPIGQAAQAVVYVPGAVPQGAGTENLQPLGKSAEAVHLAMVSPAGEPSSKPPTSVSLFDQGLVQVLGAAVTGLAPKRSYVLGLAPRRNGSGSVEPLAKFTTNPAGSAIVNAVGPIRQILQTQRPQTRHYLVIVSHTGTVEQIQTP
jgi:hypothetical protein